MTDFPNRTISWDVPFEKGTLKAVARNSGKPVAEHELNTTGPPAKIVASCNEKSLKADRTDLAYIFVTLCDEAGNTVYSADNEITCKIDGPVRLLGLEDSNPSNTENYKDNKQHTYHGKLLIYVQALDSNGKATVVLTSPGLAGTQIILDVVK
jgi:hypothetical protein